MAYETNHSFSEDMLIFGGVLVFCLTSVLLHTGWDLPKHCNRGNAGYVPTFTGFWRPPNIVGLFVSHGFLMLGLYFLVCV